ncbi:MAG: NAD(P) transhydrogenase subunit alpha [Saprospiraceae bacterium]|nr:NAD(P) transhydrogenase subunit alpha [Saprospiraceae bacterium]MCB9322665.1 NAD(P) transhydrogenase subunit alpha [Lewinellaceae bacterium]
MKLGVLKEQNDNRVALVPQSLSKFKDLGIEILIETGAGEGAMHSDADYAEHATVTSRGEIIQHADLLLSIDPLSDEELKMVPKGRTIIAQFEPFLDKEITGKLQSMGLNGLSMDMIPRTSLAQAMDVLSSMASVAGYRAVLEAATYLPRFLPMMITAAGSIKPSRVLILGAGVAGLQAIATARRLGAIVEASDTRLAAKEEVESLGAKFVEVEGAKDDTSAGGYAVQQSEEFLQRQRAEVQLRASKADIIITTAQVRGRKAPILIPKETIGKMKKGAVIVDLASSTGGNVEGSKDKEVVKINGVTIIGNSSLASKMPEDASFLYSTNVLNFVKILIKDGALHLDKGNEIIRGAWFTEPAEA